jgi:hypothetical protein
MAVEVLTFKGKKRIIPNDTFVSVRMFIYLNKVHSMP